MYGVKIKQNGSRLIKAPLSLKKITLQTLNAQNYILFKISASHLFLKYS